MQPRTRILAALAREQPDRVPKVLGFRVKEFSGRDDEALARELGLAARFVEFEPSDDDQRLADYLRGLPPDVDVGDLRLLRSYVEWGYEPNVVETNPLGTAQVADDIRRFAFPDVGADPRHRGLRDRVSQCHAEGYAVVGAPPRLGGELFETGYRLRGFERFMEDLAGRPTLADYLLDQLEAIMRRNVAILGEAGIDVLAIDDDVAIATGMLISPMMWRRYFKPRLRRIIRAARLARPELRVLYHSDGNFTDIVGDLIEIGVDAVNPLQPDHMDPSELKARFGGQLAFWGAIGSQTLMAQGSPEDVREEVRARIASLGPAGYVACPAYDVNFDVPWENVLAFSRAVDDFGQR